MRGDSPQGEQKNDGPRRPSGRTVLIVALIVLGLGYVLAVKLREMGRLQDCIMSGRRDCAPVSRSQSE